MHDKRVVSMVPSACIAFAQLNFAVGDIDGNVAKMIAAARRAYHERGARLIVFSELSVTGYPPEDLLHRSDFLNAAVRSCSALGAASRDIAMIVGAPWRDNGKLYNAALYFAGGKLVQKYYKMLLPNYAVFDERRYFSPGIHPCVVQCEGVRIGMSVCEDVWEPQPLRAICAAHADIVVNLNASPFHVGKRQQRIKMLRQRVRETRVPVIYVNQTGGQDELVFDGASFVIGANGEIPFVAPEFEEGIYSCQMRCEDSGVALTCHDAPATALEADALVWQALRTGVQDYLGKNGFSGAVLGLSGGIDSALTLLLAVEALGAEHVTAVMMPSRYTSTASIEDARTLARRCRVQLHEIAIDRIFTLFLEQLAPVFVGTRTDATEENIQARIRGLLLMAISNKFGLALLATGNKSEMATGYATLYGDMAGAFAPLKDVVKTLVYRLAHFCNRRDPRIPRRVLERPPSAELAPQQRDQDSLPPYAELDVILQQFIEANAPDRDILERGCNPATVQAIKDRVMRYEYKRRQAPVGIKITRSAFGRDWRYPIASKYRG